MGTKGTDLPMGRRERELRELVDALWAELPADVVLGLPADVVDACRDNHELLNHGGEDPAR